MTPEENEKNIGLEEARNGMDLLPVDYGMERMTKMIKAIEAEANKNNKLVS